MRKYLFIFAFILIECSFTTLTYAQKYQSLLWEISGNGLSKKSYIYGTMHVSGRIAYYLGEQFYEALKNVDAMALESNPIIWLKEINESKNADHFLGEYAVAAQIYGDFYKKAFSLILPENAELGAALSADNFLMNWLLYRENKRMSDFEEDTFLDMFIYQAGRKSNKPVYSLEDFSETNILVIYANLPDKEEVEPSDWFVKLTKEKSYWDLMQDAYRNQNLDFLDSLQSEVSGENHMKYMLHERNIIMAKNIDSIIKTGQSLFSGVGAGHLPGEKGMIELLRGLGYTLTPIKPTINDKAKEEKERLSKLKRTIPFNQEFQTELFSIKLPSPMYETYADTYLRDFFAPELTNGSFFSVSLVSTYAYLSGNSNTNYISKVDSLLFEYIPGKILSKKSIERNGFQGIDIINQTKAGDVQRYHVFITPMHMMIFKMGGKHDWVQIEGDTFFKNIQLIELSKEWGRVRPLKGDFSIELPKYHSIKNNTKITSLYGHLEIEAFDVSDSSFFLVKRGVYQDLKYLEEDDFELNRIVDKFLETLKLDSAEFKNISVSNGYPSIDARCKSKDGRYIHLKCIIKGAYYYLLVSSEKSESRNSLFFESFNFDEQVHLFPKMEHYDSLMRFRVHSNFLLPDPYIQQLHLAKARLYDDEATSESEKSYNQDQSEIYISENYEQIAVEMTVFSPYAFIKNVDEYWDKKIKFFKEHERFLILQENRGNENNMPFLELSLGDSSSSRLIFKKYIIHVNRLFTLTSNVDTLSENSSYVSDFYNSFMPVNEDLNAVSIFDDKALLFFSNIQNQDSMVRDEALNAVSQYVYFEENHVEQMIGVIENYPFGAEYMNAKISLLKDLGKINHPSVLPFLSDYYMQMSDTSLYQLAILEGLANQHTKAGTQQIIKLLEKDIPVVNDWKAIENVFRPFYDSLSLATYLFPELLNYTFVNTVYEETIYSLLALSVSENKVNHRVYRRSTNDMIKKAKILLKGERSATQKNKNYFGINQTLWLFTDLLFPYHRKKQYAQFVDDVMRLNLRFQAELIPAMLINNIKVTDEFMLKLSANIKNYHYLATVIYNLDEKYKEELPKFNIDKERLCRSRLFYNGSGNPYDEIKDSIVFLRKEFVKTRRNEGWVYFYKSKREKEDKWTLAYIGIQPIDLSKFSINLSQSKTNISIPRGSNIEDLIRKEIRVIELKDRPRAAENEYDGYEFDYW